MRAPHLPTHGFPPASPFPVHSASLDCSLALRYKLFFIFARPQDATAAVQLDATEHHTIRWCTRQELPALSPPLSGAVRWYCEQALREVA